MGSRTIDGEETALQKKIEGIVSDGRDVQNRISQVVTEEANKFQLNQQGLLALSRSIMDGATAALTRAMPNKPDSVLRPVIDGLGDGLGTAALAARLAFEEAKAQEKSFADEDLTKLSTDLRTLGDLFVDTVSHTANKFKSLTATELGALRKHVEQVAKRLMPAIESTLTAVKEHPFQFSNESVEMGVSATKQALGGLFAAIARRMQEASQTLLGSSVKK